MHCFLCVCISGASQHIQPLLIIAKVPPEHQERSPGLDQEQPKPSCIKEEREEVWTRLEGDQHQKQKEAVVPGLQFPNVSVKREEDEEKPQLSRLQQGQNKEYREVYPPASSSGEQMEAEALGEGCRGSESASDLDVPVFAKGASSGQFSFSKCFTSETDVFEWHLFSDSGKDSDAVSHKSSHNNKKLCKCPVCNKTFKHKNSVRKHMSCHTGEMPYECVECGKKFRQKGSLDKHKRTHTGEKPFSCLVCGKNFSQSGTRVAHMRTHTGEKPFSCSICKKRYRDSGALGRHRRVHTGEKPFTCTLCGKKFREKGNLKQHNIIHTGEKPVSCSKCEKKFSFVSHLKNHKCPGKKNFETVEQRFS